MASEVEICNVALAMVRGGSINSLTESSLQAQQCKLHYNLLRDQVLEDAPWGFAHKIRQLAALSSVDIWNWVYAYQYPSDCIRINKLMPDYEEVSQDSSVVAARLYDYGLPKPNLDQQIEYQLFNEDGTLVIACNEKDVYMSYNRTVTDPNLFSVKFRMALSSLLAAHVAIPLAGEMKGTALRKEALSVYSSYIRTAASDDMNQRYQYPQDSDFINVRS